MTNIFFSHDETSARAYEANQLANAGYETEAQMVRRQSVNLAPLFDAIRSAAASLFSRDLPAALAYEASLNDAAGYLPETAITEKEIAWTTMPAPRTTATYRLAPSLAI